MSAQVQVTLIHVGQCSGQLHKRVRCMSLTEHCAEARASIRLRGSIRVQVVYKASIESSEPDIVSSRVLEQDI